jgi:hypothetical protein
MNTYSAYNVHKGAYKPVSVIIGEVLLIILGLMIGASLAFYLCIKTMPVPYTTTIYVNKQ